MSRKLDQVYEAVCTTTLDNPSVWYGTVGQQMGWWAKEEGSGPYQVIYLGRNAKAALAYVKKHLASMAWYQKS